MMMKESLSPANASFFANAATKREQRSSKSGNLSKQKPQSVRCAAKDNDKTHGDFRKAMIRRPIRNLSSDKPTPPRLFDVLIDVQHPDEVYIEQKVDKNRVERIPWDDVKHQVESAIRDSRPEN